MSMTGYGEGRHGARGLEAVAELRSINHRHLKIQCRVGESEVASALEARAEQWLRERLRRGTVALTVRLHHEARPEDYRVNQAVLRGYMEQLSGLSQEVPVHTLLQLPGVIGTATGNNPEQEAEQWGVIHRALEQAHQRLDQMRRAEGGAMADEIGQLCTDIEGHLEHIAARAPDIVASYAQRLTDRLNQMLTNHQVPFSTADIVREVGMFADRIDISEEIVRLRSHLDQVRTTLEQQESAGRRLDFLVQEMFRESNTIASKANDVETARRVVEIKTGIERMRELVQNVE